MTAMLLRLSLLLPLVACAQGTGIRASDPVPETAAVQASATADLASPSQEVRDAAAKRIRASFAPPPRATWEPLLASIEEGDSRASVMERLRPYDVTPGPGGSGGGGRTESYQLDALWVLECGFVEADDTVIDCDLVTQTRWVWVEPPKGFTGVWTTYYEDGEVFQEAHYQDGTVTSTRGY